MSSVGAIPSSSSASTQISSKGIRLDTAQAVAMTKEVDMITVDSRRGSMSERISRHGSRRGSQIGTAERILDSRGLEGNGPLPTAAGNLTYRNLLTGTNSRLPGALMKPFAKIQRLDRWTPRSKQKLQEMGGDPLSRQDTARSSTARSVFASFADNSDSLGFIDPKLAEVQQKIQEQLKARRQVRLATADMVAPISVQSLEGVLTKQGIALSEEERGLVIEHYEADGTVDYGEFIADVKGAEFLPAARTYGMETPEPALDVRSMGVVEPLRRSHYIAPSEDLRGAEAIKAWQFQRAVDNCPFGSDRRTFGGRWMYRSSSLIKADPVERSRFGKSSFPARKSLADVIHIIASKLDERVKNGLVFMRMFHGYDQGSTGMVTRGQLVKILEAFCIQLNEQELSEVYAKFGSGRAEDSFRYKPFIKAVETHFLAHPLGGVAGVGSSRGEPTALERMLE